MAKSKRRKGKKKGRAIKVDFSDTPESVKVKDGTHAVTVVEVEEKEGEDSGAPYLSWKLEVTEGKSKGGVLYTNTSLQAHVLFALRNILEAMGMEIPDEALKLDLEELEGGEFAVMVENEKWKGKLKPSIIDVMGLDEIDEDSEDEDEEEEEEKPKKKGKKKGKKKEEEDPEEDEEEEEDPEEDEVQIGDTVKFKEGKKRYEGSVTDIDDDVVVVDVDGEEWEVDKEDVTVVEED